MAQTKNVDKITVKDITKNSGYSIATFYRHFRDKYDLIAWDYSCDVGRFLEQADGTQVSWLQSLMNAAVYYDASF